LSFSSSARASPRRRRWKVNLLVDDVLRVFAEGKLDGGLVEAGVAHDAQILMVLLTLIEALLEVASGLRQQQ
jgi:hypothetical protein